MKTQRYLIDLIPGRLRFLLLLKWDIQAITATLALEAYDQDRNVWRHLLWTEDFTEASVSSMIRDLFTPEPENIDVPITYCSKEVKDDGT